MRNSRLYLKQVMRLRSGAGSLCATLLASALLVCATPTAAVADMGPTAASVSPAPKSAPVVTIAWTVPAAFTEGMSAITQGDNAGVTSAISALGTNPLATYLKFRWLMDTVNQNPDQVVAFLKAHPAYPFSRDLKVSLLRSLVQQNDWVGYLAAIDLNPALKSSTQRTCHTLQAAIETNSIRAEQIDVAEKIWTRGRSQPDYCDPLFAWLKDHHHLTAELYRTRIRAAVLAGNISLGRYLVREGTAQKITGLDHYFAGWQAVEEAPEQIIRDALARQSHRKIGAEERSYLIQALRRLSRLDPQATHDYLDEIPAIWAISSSDRDDIARRVALKAAYTRMPQAYAWLKALPGAVQDEETQTWRARAALRAEDWQKLKAAIAAMPLELSQQSQWQYWLARADAALGDQKAADARWASLLHEPDYYGFLAADRLGIDYPWPKLPPLPVVPVTSVAANPGAQLAFYLRAAGLTDDARRAFSAALSEISPAQIPALTILAEQNHWYDRVSIAIAKMRKQNDPAWFAARFPTPWHALVDQQASTQGVDPNWLYAMIRRESLFMSDVGSGVGAQGLMQLMPRTAHWINRKAGLGLTNLDLHDPATSITLGSAYLSYLTDRFSGQLPLAIAAYNAGPGRVKQWLPESRTLPGDVWVDTILFDETRNYVRAVLAATVIYAWRDRKDPLAVGHQARAGRASQTPETLASLLSPIQPTNPAPEPTGETASIPASTPVSSPVAAVAATLTVPVR